MAIIHGKAGESASMKVLRKRQNALIWVFATILPALLASGIFFGLSFSENVLLKVISFFGVIVIGGTLFALRRKMDKNLEAQLREAKMWNRGVPFFLASVKASRATVERAVRALVRAGRIEHRGSRKTGGYFAKERVP